MRELEASIAKSGILTALLVRPHGARYQIIAGERRWLAAKKLSLEAVPCRVKELSDEEAIEFLIVENLQREDVHPLDEADGYVALMKKQFGYDIDKIAERVGRSKKYVYDRIKLLQLAPEAKELFRAGTLSAGHAIILARLSPSDQKRAVTLGKNYGDRGGLYGDAENDLFSPYYDQSSRRRDTPRVVSVRELQGWVDANVRFDPTAADAADLFPETVKTVTQATEKAETVVLITHERWWAGSEKKERADILQPDKWKRADGKHSSKRCEDSVIGVVSIGPDRGDSFRVCVARECKVHWKEERQRAATSTASKSASDKRWEATQRQWQEKERRQKALRDRWTKARPALLKTLSERLKTAPAGANSPAAKLVIAESHFARHADKTAKALLPRVKSAEDVIRALAFGVLADTLTSWNAPTTGVKQLKAFGIDARKILDQAAPVVQTSAKKNGKAQKKRVAKKR